jgi:hypothetical protein
MMPGKPTIGFVTALEKDTGSFVGGYLIVNHVGRPVEFQCTMPVRPNRAQRVLYGPTLIPYLFGELIAQTLIRAAVTSPGLLLTDQQAVLAVREHVEMPVAHVKPHDPWDRAKQPSSATVPILSGSDSLPLSRADADTPSIRQCLECHPHYVGDRTRIERALREFDAALDLTEPFARIREAIDEALNSGRSQ